MNTLHVWLCILACIFCVAAAQTQSPYSEYTAEAEADRVTALPGLDELKAGLFSGYFSLFVSATYVGTSRVPCVLVLVICSIPSL